MADLDARTLGKKLDAILEKLEKKDTRQMGGTFGNKAKSITDDKDFKRLDSHIRESNEYLQGEVDILRSDAETNKLANKVQIAKEVLDISREKQAIAFNKFSLELEA